MTIKEAANQLEVSERTIRRYAAEGLLSKFPNSRPMLISRKSVERLDRKRTGKDTLPDNVQSVTSNVQKNKVPELEAELRLEREKTAELEAELKKEREAARNATKRLADLAEKLAQLTSQAQQLHLTDQIKQVPAIEAGITEPSPIDRPSFLQRFFSRGKNR